MDSTVPSSLPKTMSRGMRVPIRTKITLPYLILSLLLAVAAAYLITQLVVENVEDRFNKQLFEAGKISSELIVTHESRILESLRLLANVDGLPRTIQDDNPEVLRSLTIGIIANNQMEAVEFLDQNSNHILSVHHRAGGNAEDYEYSTGGQTIYSNLDIVRKVIDGQVDSKGDKYADLVRSSNEDYLYISGPIYDDQGSFRGVLLVGESLAHMAADIHEKTFAQITFYDLSGKVLFSSLPYSQELAPEVAAKSVSFKDISTNKRNLSSKRDLEVSSILFSELLGSFEVRSGHELGVLGVALSRNGVVQASTTSRWRIFLLVATANFLVILVGINLANQITRPLLRLVQASLRVTHGDLDVKIIPQSNDEISVLTESFNTMVASLNQSHKDLMKSYDDTLQGWAKALELRDKETEGHSERVTDLTVRLAEAVGIHGEALVHIRRGALLHDIGKMGTPDAILHKNGPLTPEERRIIQRHPQDAYNMLNRIEYLRRALEIPYCHHEHWDGTGYPRGLKSEEIPLSARIFAVVDVWDALTSDRPYRAAMPRQEVYEYLRSESGQHFDPALIEVFIQMMQSGG